MGLRGRRATIETALRGSNPPAAAPDHRPGRRISNAAPTGGRPMSQQVIDFRELLERVLPLDHLQPPDRLRVQQALRAGLLHEVEAAAWMAMDRLEDQGALRRISSSTNGRGHV